MFIKACTGLIESLSNEGHKEVNNLLAREKDGDGGFTLSNSRLRATFAHVQSQYMKLFLPGNNKKNMQEKEQIEEAICVIAESVAYYDCAYRRFADNAAMAINALIVNKFSKSIESAMFKFGYFLSLFCFFCVFLVFFLVFVWFFCFSVFRFKHNTIKTTNLKKNIKKTKIGEGVKW